MKLFILICQFWGPEKSKCVKCQVELHTVGKLCVYVVNEYRTLQFSYTANNFLFT